MPASILATCVIPWDRRFQFEEESFRRHVRQIAGSITRHIYIFGTAGEGHAVSDAVFKEIAAAFYQEALNSSVTPMLGLISNSLATVIERIEYGIELGYRQFQLSLPSWGRLSDPELEAFFRETCGRFPAVQFLHYNTPRGGRVLTGAEYHRLARTYESLAAIKFTSSSAETVAELVTHCPPLQCFLTEPAYVLARPLVECGLLVSLSGVRASLPTRFIESDGDGLQRLGVLADEIHAALLESLGDEARDVHMDGAFEKVIARAHGAEIPLRLLPPYHGFSEAACARFMARLNRLDGLPPN